MDFTTLLTPQPDIPVWIIAVALAWSLAWKGIALWKAARNNSQVWFVALLVINTVGILEILYIFLFSKIVLPEVHEKKSKQVSLLEEKKKTRTKKKKKL